MMISERIKQVRQTLSLTQGKFAGRIVLSTSHLAGMEFDVNEHGLRTGEGSIFDDETDVRLTKAVSLFKSLSPQYKDCALNILNELAELCKSTKQP